MRRELIFRTIGDARAELDRLEKGPVETTGNWSYFQILNHCGKAVEASMRGFKSLKPWYIRRILGPIAFGKLSGRGFIPPGAGAPAKGITAERVEGDEKAALTNLRKGLDDLEKYGGPWAEHPFFGKLNREKWLHLTAMHLANHLGWAKPKE
jgi:hypothetical protein